MPSFNKVKAIFKILSMVTSVVHNRTLQSALNCLDQAAKRPEDDALLQHKSLTHIELFNSPPINLGTSQI